MSVDSRMPAAGMDALMDVAADEVAEARLQWIETALLASGTVIAVFLVVVVSVLIHLA
ncbi:MAG: hypothetical protein KJZ73_05685 [Pseudorhodoplanes sp.]|nr:hypothetical protein [Pseudorhodoplanes sp.]MCL4710720.1 hypothetical protein [Pseudorhodoplanes sp.]